MCVWTHSFTDKHCQLPNPNSSEFNVFTERLDKTVARKYFSISRQHLCTESKNIKASSFIYKNNHLRVLEQTFCVFCKGWKLRSLPLTTKSRFQRIQSRWPLLYLTALCRLPMEQRASFASRQTDCWRLRNTQETGSAVQSKEGIEMEYLKRKDLEDCKVGDLRDLNISKD